ncbi:uncharacterized protein LOC107868939 [Capsicum annuum]|uniref:uncharacterized protein LOC107868939 n=1 Tax=Capsicum annuum TaxID=4072 RepID=UPI0007BF939F|nr:uncharacterized protein LOC107868939 [Capsicum annuum]
MAMLKQLMINAPLVEALEQMPGHAKFMKDLIPKKRKADPGAFTSPCKVGSLDVAKALCDLGASMNLMPLVVWKKLGLEDQTPTIIQLVMADRSIKWPVGILHDVLVKVADFILPVDFMVLHCDVDFKVPIILGWSLFAIGRLIVGVDNRIWHGKKEAKFKIHQPVSQQNDMNVFPIIDVFNEDEKGVSIGCLGEF